MKHQAVLTSQILNKLLIGVGLRPAQLVIEMNGEDYDAELMPQFKQQP
jgi:hypothetical protein